MPETKVLEDALSVLDEKGELRPAQMLDVMRGRGFSQSETAEAVSYLIRNHQIEFTPERSLRPAAVAGQ